MAVMCHGEEECFSGADGDTASVSLLRRAQGPSAGTLLGARTTHYANFQLPNAPSPFLLPYQPFPNLRVDQKNQEGIFKQTTSPLP